MHRLRDLPPAHPYFWVKNKVFTGLLRSKAKPTICFQMITTTRGPNIRDLVQKKTLSIYGIRNRELCVLADDVKNNLPYSAKQCVKVRYEMRFT